MRIALYTESFFPRLGGMELVVDRLARGFEALGHEALVLVAEPEGKEEEQQLPYRILRGPPLSRDPATLRQGCRFLLDVHAREGFEVLHCHGIYPLAYLAALCRRPLNIPVVATSHSDLRPDHIAFYGRRAPRRTRWALPRLSALVATTRHMSRELDFWSGGRVPLVDIPLGVGLGEFAAPVPRPAGLDPQVRPGRYALFLGRLVHQKGADLLLEAFAGLGHAAAGMDLVIAGDGKERARLEARARALGLAERVRFPGWIEGSEKTYLLQNAHCVVVPSRHTEAFCLVTLESLAAGRPVIATAIPSLDERIADGVTGRLVPPEDPTALGRALGELFHDPARADRMGRRGRDEARRYAWEEIVRRHLELYEALVAGGFRGRDPACV